MTTGNHVADYDEQDYPNVFGNEYEKVECFECDLIMNEGDQFMIAGFYDKVVDVCEACKDELISAEPESWKKGKHPMYWLYTRPVHNSIDLFKTLGEMFNPNKQ